MMARSSWPTLRVFDHIQEHVGPRMLIEKSPSTTVRREYLERLLRNFPNAKVLHLVRHPRGTAESVLNYRAAFPGLQRAMGGRADSDPERVWRICHELIITVMNDLALGQCMRLKGEALLGDLDVYLPQILCEWLDLKTEGEAVAAMMHPEHRRMRNSDPVAPSMATITIFSATPKSIVGGWRRSRSQA